MLVIGTDTAARYYTMHMRVMLQSLPPGVPQGDEADFSTQVLGSGSDGTQCLCGGVKQDVVNHGLILVRDDSNLLGQCKHNVEVLNGNEVGLAIFQPLRTHQ